MPIIEPIPDGPTSIVVKTVKNFSGHRLYQDGIEIKGVFLSHDVPNIHQFFKDKFLKQIEAVKAEDKRQRLIQRLYDRQV